ncbi:hypothetical protein LSUE1_G002813 [Lachnellula suecica]|uniref:Glycoside hydrolase subgroup catalytic core n=1 Tax=Lachnellula suecica TaxID=602035 RepID=A0A8T9C7P0_9HELO|nr:hypothetical protein LSUE1_G002813 [Lachnellula suecica]
MLWNVWLLGFLSLVACVEETAIAGQDLRMRGLKQWPLGLAASLSIDVSSAFNAPADVPTWCGKPYMSSNHSLDLGGQFQFPTPQQNPLLYVTVQPRYSIFLDNDGSGSFIVDAAISHTFGQAYKNASYDTPGKNTSNAFTTLDFEIYNEDNGELLVSNSVPINSTGNLFNFTFSSFPPRFQPYQISIYGTSPDGQQTYSGTSQIYVLPARTYGSAVKIDNLYGGLYVQNANNSYTGWYSIFPNGGYADGSYVLPSNISYTPLETYVQQGFNTINVVPDGGAPEQSYDTEQLATYWDLMDELNLFNLYDMRFAFQNSTRISDQVALWQNRSTLLMWYTADEPDGWAYALNSTKLAYDQLKELDPYHPVSLVLNCQDFYYKEYASGGDVIFEDAYPVAINATWSIPWGTPCNTTYGDCGCDNCLGELADVSTRLDDLETYQENLGPGTIGRKPGWAVLQAFGEQDYWKSIPSVQEVENMMMLAVNHGAKGLTYWIYPSTDEVNVGSGEFGKVFQTETVKEFLFGTDVIKGLAVEGEALCLDIGRQMLVGVASGQYVDSEATVSVQLPVAVSGIEQVLYGDSSWAVDNGKLTKSGMKGLEVSVLVLDVSA